MKRNRLMGPAVALLSFFAFNASADIGNFESYPTERNARAFVDQYCKGMVNEFKLKADKRPRLLNSCLMFGIVTGDRDLTRKMFDRGASPLTYWTSDMHYKGSAIWPDDKGQVLDENGAKDGLAIAFGNWLSGSMDEAMRAVGEERLDPSGLGFNALTLAIEKNDTQMVQELISRDKSVLNRGDGLGRCPLTYAILLKRDAIVKQLLAQKSPALTCAANTNYAKNVQDILAADAPNSILHREDKALWMDLQSSTPVLAAYRVGNPELALYIADRINKVPAGETQLLTLLAVATASKDLPFVDRLLNIRSSLAPELLENALISGDMTYVDMAVKHGVDTRSDKAYSTLVTEAAKLQQPEKAQAFIGSLLKSGYVDSDEVSRRLMDLGKTDLVLNLVKEKNLAVSDSTRSKLVEKAMNQALGGYDLKLHKDVEGDFTLLKNAYDAGVIDAKSLTQAGALQKALLKSNTALSDLLLSMGVDPNARDSYFKKTPIEVLVSYFADGDDYLKKGIDAGMSPCLNTPGDNSLLITAALAGKIAYLAQLQDILKAASPKDMNNILFAVIEGGNITTNKVTQFLDQMIAKGVSLADAKNSDGENLLSVLARSRCEPKLVEYLIKNGVSASDTRDDGKSAADLAYRLATDKKFGKDTYYRCNTPELAQETNACVRTINTLVKNGSDFSYDPAFNRSCRKDGFGNDLETTSIPLNVGGNNQGYGAQPAYNPYQQNQAQPQQPARQSQRSYGNDGNDDDADMKVPGIVQNSDGTVEINGVKFGNQGGCTETVTIINGNVNRTKVCN
jgi:ankyrin repeat protein